MKTQFHPDSTAKCSWHKAFTGWTKTQSDPIKTQLRPNPVMPCRRTLRPGAPRTRRLLQPICRQFVDQDWEFADLANTVLRESTDNLPIFARNLPILARVELRNPSIIHRRVGSIDRSGCRNRSVESSDNRQMIRGNRQIAPNRKPIVNRFAIIVNSAAWNPSTLHQQNAEIYHRAGRPPAIRLPESSDNHPTKRRNHPMESANLPTNFRDLPIL